MGKEKRDSIENWRTPTELKIKKRTIIPPEEGWEDDEWYAIDVSFGAGNPIHEGVYYRSEVGLYSFVITTDGQAENIRSVYYMKGIRKLNIRS